MMQQGSEKSVSQRKALGGLLGLFLLVMVWQYVLPALQEWMAGQDAQILAKRQVAETREMTKNPVVTVRMDYLGAEAGAYLPNRNIFRYGQRKVVRPPPTPPPTPPPRGPDQDREPPPPPPPATPRPPNINFELMGIFGPENRRIAVLIDGEEIINALQEDVLKEQFIVNEIGLQSVEFRFVDFPADETARIEIGER